MPSHERLPETDERAPVKSPLIGWWDGALLLVTSLVLLALYAHGQLSHTLRFVRQWLEALVAG